MTTSNDPTCVEAASVNGKCIVKSGTDFRSFGKITITFDECGKFAVGVEKVDIVSSLEEDHYIKDVVSKYMDVVDTEKETVLGEIEVELDGRFSTIRNTETNLGNFVADIMLEAVDADVALLNGGTFRSDALHPVGSFRLKDLMAILPMIDFITVLMISGQQIIDALENGVSKYPMLEGRFPQVAGISFGFNPRKLPGQRIDPRRVKVQGSYIELDKHYRLCTKSYLAEGKDGYDVFRSCKQLMAGDNSPVLTTLIQNYFKDVGVCRGQKKSCCHQRNISVNRQKCTPNIEGRIFVISAENDKDLDDRQLMVCTQKSVISDDASSYKVAHDRLS